MGLASRLLNRHKLVGIDISSSSVKLIELSKKSSDLNYTLTAIANVDLPDNTIINNTIIDNVAVSQAVSQAIKESGTKSKHVVFSVSGNSVIIKLVQMDSMTEVELTSQISIEATQHMNIDIDQLYIDFQILGMTEGSDGELMDVVLVVCKKEVVEDYKSMFTSIGMIAKCMDCDVFATENSAEITDVYQSYIMSINQTNEDDIDINSIVINEASAIINIGENTTNINVMIDGQMTVVKDAVIGGKKLTRMIEEDNGVSFSEAENIKINDFYLISEDTKERFYDDLVSNIMMSLESYAIAYPEFPVSKLFICGGTSLLVDIDIELSKRLSVDVQIINPMLNIEVDEGKFKDSNKIILDGPRYVVPIGLALRSFDR